MTDSSASSQSEAMILSRNCLYNPGSYRDISMHTSKNCDFTEAQHRIDHLPRNENNTSSRPGWTSHMTGGVSCFISSKSSTGSKSDSVS